MLTLTTPCGNKRVQLNMDHPLSEMTRAEFITLYAFLRTLEDKETRNEIHDLTAYPDISRN